MNGCYLLHFSRPMSRASHYLGTSRDIDARIQLHRDGRGASITAAAVLQGITFEHVRTWPGASRAEERRLKNRKDAHALCPICRAERRRRQRETRQRRERKTK